MKIYLFAGCIASAAFTFTPVNAQVVAKDAWIRATVTQQKVTGAFMQLQSPKAVTLIEATSPAAGNVEIHTMEIQDNVMKMRALTSLELPAGKAVELKPGGYHIMLFNLKAQVKVGDIIPITLTVEDHDKKRETIVVQATAKALTQ